MSPVYNLVSPDYAPSLLSYSTQNQYPQFPLDNAFGTKTKAEFGTKIIEKDEDTILSLIISSMEECKEMDMSKAETLAKYPDPFNVNDSATSLSLNVDEDGELGTGFLAYNIGKGYDRYDEIKTITELQTFMTKESKYWEKKGYRKVFKKLKDSRVFRMVVIPQLWISDVGYGVSYKVYHIDTKYPGDTIKSSLDTVVNKTKLEDIKMTI